MFGLCGFVFIFKQERSTQVQPWRFILRERKKGRERDREMRRRKKKRENGGGLRWGGGERERDAVNQPTSFFALIIIK